MEKRECVWMFLLHVHSQTKKVNLRPQNDMMTFDPSFVVLWFKHFKSL